MAQVGPITSDGESASTSWGGGRANISVYGAFDGAWASIQYSRNNGADWIDIIDGFADGPVISFRRNGGLIADLPPCEVRAIVRQAGGSTSLTLEVEGV